MTSDSIDEFDFIEFVNKIQDQTLEEVIASVPAHQEEDLVIPMAFIDSNCFVILRACKKPQTFESAGELCVHASKVANYKYGENKTKLMEQIGVLTINTQTTPHEVTITDIGNYILTLGESLAISVMIRLSVRLPAIHRLLAEPLGAQVNIASIFSEFYSYTTIKRRSSSIIHIIKDIEEEYCTSGYSNRLFLSRGSLNEVIDGCENGPLSIKLTNSFNKNDTNKEQVRTEVSIPSKSGLMNYLQHQEYSCELGIDEELTKSSKISHPLSECEGEETNQQVGNSKQEIEVKMLPKQPDSANRPSHQEQYCESDDSFIKNNLHDPLEDDEVADQQISDSKSCETDWQMCMSHPVLSKIKSFINKFYKIRKESKVSSMFESLINIIEDPSSEYITQTLAYLPLGFFVKYGRLTEQSLKETECVCFLSLLKIYEINMDLMIYNLSDGFSLNDFYNLREVYAVKYGLVLQDIRKRSCIDEFFNRVIDEVTSEKYHAELEQLYVSESNLYFRLVTNGTDMLDEDSLTRSIQIISQSRLEYPTDGIDCKYIPLLKNDDVEDYRNDSIKDCILSEIREVSYRDDISRLWDYCFEDWRDTVNELLLLAYILSPHRIIQTDDIDIMYVVYQTIADKLDLYEDESIQLTINTYYGSCISRMPDDLQIKILNRVNSILIYSFLNIDFSLTTNIQDDVACITRVCHYIDNKTGRKANYKSRLGIGSSLDIFEKADVNQIRKHREYTDSERSRHNRYVNKMRYDYVE